MYILSLENGYAEIIQNENNEYSIVDHKEYSVADKITVHHRKRTVHLIPVGQIVFDRFNRSWDEYKKLGGKRTAAITKHGVHSDCPQWIFPDDKPQEFDFYNPDLLNLPYIPVIHLTINGSVRELFKVKSLSELYFYDLSRLKLQIGQVKQCISCGHAFIAKTKAIVCDDCRKSGVIEERKRENLKKDKTRSTIKNIKDRISKRNCMYTDYLNNLCAVIDSHKDADTDDCFKEFIAKLDIFDRKYFELCKYFTGDTCYCEDDYFKEWQQSKTQFPNVADMEEWLRGWFNKIGLQYDKQSK